MATNTPETYGYKGWMNSDSFLKRSFGVLGYQLVASLIIQACLLVLMLIFMFAFGGMAFFFSNR